MQTGERIKARRKELGINADALAEAVGVDRSTIFRYENGGIENVSLKNVEPIAKALRCSPAYLLGWEDSTNEKWPIPENEDELDAEQKELVRLFDSASPEIRTAALAVLKSAEGQDEAPNGASTDE